MNQDGGNRRRPRRPLSAEERALWHTITKSVAPLRRRKAVPESVDKIAPDEIAKPTPPPRAAEKRPAPAAPKKSPPPLAPLERRTKQRLARGSTMLDARLDLHGMTQDQAHSTLLGFLRRAQNQDARMVLVITGKGARTSEHAPYAERGVLRRLAPQWLALPAFRAYVVGFETAHVTHGGEGALYVRLRRRPG
jgi:DNA-nicking Smr family endonuclease